MNEKSKAKQYKKDAEKTKKEKSSQNEDSKSDQVLEEDPNLILYKTMELYEEFGYMMHKFYTKTVEYKNYQVSIETKIEELEKITANSEFERAQKELKSYSTELEKIKKQEEEEEKKKKKKNKDKKYYEDEDEDKNKEKKSNKNKSEFNLENIFFNIKYPNNFYVKCHKCLNGDNRTTMLQCGDSFCAKCLYKEYGSDNHRLRKCLMENCYHIINDEEFSRVMGYDCIMNLKNFASLKSTCVICKQKIHKEIIECKNQHGICRKCFKSYGEYITNYEILQISEKSIDKTIYNGIPCPAPDCYELIDPKHLFVLFNELRQKIILQNAEERYRVTTQWNSNNK